MARLTVTPGHLPVADLPDHFQADIRHVGNLLHDLGKPAQPSQVARGDAEHLALFELPQAGQRGVKLGRRQERLQHAVDFAAQPLPAAGKLERLRLERANPIRPGDKQIAERLGGAEDRSQDARLVSRTRLQRGAGAGGGEKAQERLGLLRVRAGTYGVGPGRAVHARVGTLTAESSPP